MSLTKSEVFSLSKNAAVLIAIAKTATFHHGVKVAVANITLALRIAEKFLFIIAVIVYGKCKYAK